MTDNGKGLPENFDLENSPSFGFRIVKLLAHQIRGTISAHSKNGTTFEIIVPAASDEEKSSNGSQANDARL